MCVAAVMAELGRVATDGCNSRWADQFHVQRLSAGSGASAGALPRASGKLPERCAHRHATQINSNTQYGTLSVAIEGRLMLLAGAARKCAAVRTERAAILNHFTLWGGHVEKTSPLAQYGL